MSAHAPGADRPTSPDRTAEPRGSFLTWAAFGGACLAIAWASARWASTGAVTVIAPMAGVLVGVTIALPRRTVLAYLAVAALAHAIADFGVAGAPVFRSMLVAGVVAGQALVAGLALRRVGGPQLELRSIRELLRFLGVGVLLAPLVANMAGVLVLRAAGVELGGLGAALATRWAADATGILVVAPLAAGALRRCASEGRGPHRKGERFLALLATTGGALVLFGPLSGDLPTLLRFPHGLAPLCLWVALRAGVRGALVAAALVAGVVVGATGVGFGPFAAVATSDVERAGFVQVYIALTSLLTVGAAIVTGRLERMTRALASRGRALANALATIARQRAHLQAVLDTMAEAVVVCDERGHCDLFNRAAARLRGAFAASGCAGVGEAVEEISVYRADGSGPLSQDELPMRHALRGLASDRVRLLARPDGELSGGAVLEANARALRTPDGAVRGAVVVWTDVTSVVAAETERVRLVADLQRTLSEVKALRGILPICGYCKRIRDEQGGWTRLEQFVAERSQASFSHGVCPDCLRLVRGLPRGGGTPIPD